MPVGAGSRYSPQDIQQRSGQIVQNIINAFDDLVSYRNYILRNYPDAASLATFLGSTQPEATKILNSLTDMENLRLTAYGQRAQSPANNFFFTAIDLTGW